MIEQSFVADKFKDLVSVSQQFKEEYIKGDPFPNIVFKDFFNESWLDKVLSEFPDLSKKDTVSHNNAKEKKYGSKGEKYFGPYTKVFMNYLNSESFLNFLQSLTGIKETLIPDPYFVGGGQHQINKGGLLKIHVDFNKHPKTNLDRRLNLLIYLNKDWNEAYGGHFELWESNMERCGKKIAPTFNTIAIFSTTSQSFHGHPDPLNCPANRSRQSLALYYYSNGRPLHEIDKDHIQHSTIFKARKFNNEDNKAFSLFSKGSLKQTIALFIPPIILKIKDHVVSLIR